MDVTEAPRANPPRSPRSLVDLWIDSVDRVAPQPWPIYLVIGAVLIGAELLLDVAAGVRTQPFTIYFAVAGVYALALLHYLRRAAGAAFDEFRPALDPSADTNELRTRLTTMPAGVTEAVAGGAVILALIVLLAGSSLQGQVGNVGLADSPLGIAFNLVLYGFNWAATAALLLRVVLQSMAVDRIIRDSRVDLFDQAPLHAFSFLNAKSVVGLAVVFYAPVLILAAQGNAVAWTVLRVVVAIVLLGVFIWPLLGAHGRLNRERQRLLRQNAERIERFYSDLHDRFDADERGVPDAARNEIDTLEREQRMLRAVPTWPWASDVGPAVMGAIILPLIFSVLLSIVQRIVPD